MNANIVLHRSKTRKRDGRHPVVVRITKDRTYNDKVVKGYYYYLEEWNEKTNLPKGASAKLKKYFNNEVNKYLDAAIDTEANDLDIPISSVIDSVTGGKKTAPSVLKYYDKVIERLRANNQIKTAGSYHGCRNNLESYLESFEDKKKKKLKRTNLRFGEITVNFLNDYKMWLDGEHFIYDKKSKVKSSYFLKDNTKHIYLRTLRSLYNKAIDDGYAKVQNYPFRTFFKNQSFDTETEKKAITSKDIESIKNIENLTEMETEAQIYFLFGYYGMGINFVDIAHLKWSNIREGKILYRRKKLSRKKKQKTFAIPYEGMIKTIVQTYRKGTGIDPDNYIFPVLSKEDHKTPQQQHDRVQKVITRVNKDLKAIGAKAGIKKKISTYTWRHTAFTVLKLEKNIPIAMISQAAGHSSVAVTEIYLDSFGAEQEEGLYGVL